MSNPLQSNQRWRPTVTQLDTPEKLHTAMRQVLDQHYRLQDQHNALQKRAAEMEERLATLETSPPRGSGPTDTMLLGLPVQPVDTNTLANGAKLTWVKSSGNFQVL